MTVENQQVRWNYVGDGSTRPFPVTAPFFLSTDLLVLLDGAEQPSGYSVSGGGGSTGTVTFASAPGTGVDVTIILNVPLTQLKNFVDGTAFPSATIDEVNDRAVQALLRIDDKLSRAMVAPDGDINPDVVLPSAEQRANTYVTFDASGNLSLAQALPSGTLSQSSIGLFLYPRTAAETSASVTVVNPWYPPLTVDRYVTNISGVTDTVSGWNAAIKVAKTSGGTVRYGATAPYLVMSPIDCTQAAGSTQFGFTIVQEANFTASTLNPPTYPSIIAKHTGHVFDCAGATGINFENVTVGTDTTTFPKTCWFLARNTAGSSQIHRFTKCMVHGKFSNSIVYNYGSENEQYVGCQFFNVSTGAGTRVITWTGSNISSLSSTFIAIATGVQSCIDHQVIGGQFWNASGDAAADVFYLEGATDSIKIHGPWVKCGVQGGAGGRAIVYVDGTNSISNFISIYNLTTEHAGGGVNQNKYGILFSNNVRTPTGWMIDGGVWDNQTFAIACAGASVALDNFTIRDISESVSHGISVPGTLQNSYFAGPNVLSIGTSSRNFIVGFKVGMTITTRSNDVIIDNFTGGITLSGGLGVWGANPMGQTTGFGVPTGNAVVANFPGATATLLQTSQTVAELLLILKQMGLLGA